MMDQWNMLLLLIEMFPQRISMSLHALTLSQLVNDPCRVPSQLEEVA